jgi:hypothetical protein
MKKILKKPLWLTTITTQCVIVVTLFAATGCDKLYKPYEFCGKIEAKVENASKYSNVVVVKLMIGNIELARGDWKNGGFTIEFPETLNPSYLHALINNNNVYMNINEPPSTVKITNKYVKVYHAVFLGVDINGKVVDRFYPIEIDKNGWGQDVFFTYVDSDVTISGYTERRNDVLLFTEYDEARFVGMDIHPMSFGKITTTYSIKWKIGWNVWSFSRFYPSMKNKTTEKWSSTPASKLKWYSGKDLRVGNR